MLYDVLRHGPKVLSLLVLCLVLGQKELLKKPVLLCANSPRGLIDEEVAELESKGISVHPVPHRAIRALKGLVEYGERIKKINRS